ncbi:MAG: hypothetical protein J0L75_13180 [Spirochaetes bacterium]|nr:hypothetical protein [Spirochaetota bacterium]
MNAAIGLPAILLFFSFLAALRFIWGMRLLFKKPRAYPSESYLRKLRRHPTPHVLACLGDSITQGDLGVSYVRMLEGRWDARALSIVNAGINGDLAESLWRRLDAVIAARPTLVTLLIGTNDVNAAMSPANMRRYIKQGKIAVPSTFERYQEHVRRTLDRVRAETPARVAILSLPFITTELAHPVNVLGDRYSAWLKELASKTGAAYLPLREAQKAFLAERVVPPKYGYADADRLMVRCVFGRMFGVGWDALSRIHGNPLSVDHLHSNTRTAAMIADLVAGFAQEELTRKPAQVGP